MNWTKNLLTIVLAFPVSGSFCVSAHAENDAELAQALSNPLAALISVPIQFNYDEGFGDGSGYRLFTNFQPVIPVSLNENWNLISRTIVPVILEQKGISPSEPDARQSGFGDTVQSLFFSPKAPQSVGALGNLIWGVGPVFALPTGKPDQLLGSGKWSAGPTAVALFQKGGLTYGALGNHLWSFAGDDDTADVNSTFVQPFLSYTTPTAWSYTINSESTYNWETDQWSVPVNLIVGKMTSIGTQKVSIAGGVRYWVESPEFGPDDFGVRLAVTFLFPK